MFFIKYKYEQKPNTINKWVGLRVSGLLCIPLPNFTEGSGDGELVKLGRNKSIMIPSSAQYSIFAIIIWCCPIGTLTLLMKSYDHETLEWMFEGWYGPLTY